MSEKDIPRMVSGTSGMTDSKPPLPIHGQQQLPNSKSVPALHHVGNSMGKYLMAKYKKLFLFISKTNRNCW